MTPDILPPTKATIARAVDHLARGELVAFPTETVYGLGADAGNADAVRAIFAAKGRPADHPVIVHVAEAHAIAWWARDVPAAAQRLAAAFWPGPLTLILPRTAHAADVLTGGQDSIGLRVPSHPVARELLRAFAAVGGTGIAGPSANRFGRISPTTPQHVADDLRDRVALIVDGGACAVGIESTIVAFRGGVPVLLRPGGIPAEAIERLLGRALLAPDAAAPRASGTLASHYAPRTPTRLVAGAGFAATIATLPQPVAVLAHAAARPAHFHGAWLAAPADPVAYAHDLYASLRTLDAAGAATIAVERVPDAPAWAAVRDRLARASQPDADDDRG